MTERPSTTRPTRRRAGRRSSLEASAIRGTERPAPAAPREALDRQEQADQGRRPAHGLARRGGDPRAPAGRSSTHDADLALDVIKARAGHQRGAARGVAPDHASTIATQSPVARDLRYLLTLDHVTYELERIGDHASSRRQAGHQAGARAAARGLRRPARDGRARRPVLVHGVLRALVDVDAVAGPRGRGPRRRDRPALPRDVRRGRRR